MSKSKHPNAKWKLICGPRHFTMSYHRKKSAARREKAWHRRHKLRCRIESV